MAITINGSTGITSSEIADGTITNADVNDVAASKLTGALPAIDGSSLTGVGGANTPAFQARRSSYFSFSDNTYTKVTGFVETFDTDNNFTSDRFTPTTAGKYFVLVEGSLQGVNSYDMYNGHIEIRKNGAAISNIGSQGNVSYRSHRYGLVMQSIVDMNGTTDYLEMWVYLNNSGSAGAQVEGDSAAFSAFKLIT